MAKINIKPPQSPYKFLDYYEMDDRDIFFGRERETATLVSDVISTRIVVLFAKTGSGKTSLINAGVRPRLRELDYETLYIRVERDPAASVRTALRNRGLLPDDTDETAVALALRSAARQLQRPIVVFFDQFEEFFIYTRHPGDEERARDFISNVAVLYRDRESGVHTVFSMREEYFVEMDAFRDEIPSIFHNESSLRLQPFDKQQARRAIQLPAREAGVEVSEKLVDTIIADLAENDRVEPARLQIVCDTLWNESKGTRIGIAIYRRLGRATRILGRRLKEDINRLTDPQLDLLGKLLPELQTEFGTKYTRGLEELVDRLGTDRTSLKELIEELKALRLLRETTIHRALYVEWTSDYLAERTGVLQETVRAITLRRLLAAALQRARATDANFAADPVLSSLHARSEEAPSTFLSSDDLSMLSQGAFLLGELDSTEAAFVFAASIAHGSYMAQWFDIASKSEVDVWDLLRTVLTHGGLHEGAVENVVRLLGELGGPIAMDLLEIAVKRPPSAATALRVLEDMRSEPAITLLTKVIRETGMVSEAIDALRRMGSREAVDALARIARTGDVAALRAATALSLLAAGSDDQPVTGQAKAAQDNVLGHQAAPLFLLALRHGLEVSYWFDRAQEHGVHVWEILRESVTGDDVPIEQAKGAVRLLFELPEQRSRELLELASREDRLAEVARKALSAKDALERDTRKAVESKPPLVPAGSGSRLGGPEWQDLLSLIEEGRCTPVIGPGASGGVLPSLAEIAEKWRYKFELPGSGPADLAYVSQLLAIRRGAMYPKREMAAELRRARPDFSDPSNVHAVLADLPFSVYLVASHDDLMVEALRSRGRDPHQDFLPSEQQVYERRRKAAFTASPTQPLVFHLFGSVNQPESLAITEDDYFEVLISLIRRSDIPPEIRRAVAQSTLMYIGVGLGGWPFRVLIHGLVNSVTSGLFYPTFITLLPSDLLSGSDSRDDLALWARSSLGRGGAPTYIYWGTSREFAWELRERWHSARSGS